MTSNMSISKAMRVGHRLSLISMFLLFATAEIIAMSNFWGRREMHLDIYSVSLMPILIAIPLGAWIQVRRRIRKGLPEPGVNQIWLVNVQYWLTSLTAIFYAMLSLTMSMLLNAIMHLRR
ncbi:MAG TPA: hypothetical protein VGK24_15760 [Candidatus Angelobacter sp.]|jgi:hypothetical protein